MPKAVTHPTGREITFAEDELIVSKTDLRGIITYANDVFLRVSGYPEQEVLGAPHNLIRHPEMPRCVFQLLWQALQQGREIFAYVLNMAANGDGYWVFAHVTPSYDTHGRMVGYHSNRRVPHAEALSKVRPLYEELRSVERRHSVVKAAALAGTDRIQAMLTQHGLEYGEFVFGLSASTALKTSTR